MTHLHDSRMLVYPGSRPILKQQIHWLRHNFWESENTGLFGNRVVYKFSSC